MAPLLLLRFKLFMENGMKKIVAIHIMLIVTVLFLYSGASALTIMPSGDYTTPADWRVIASLQPTNGITLDHYSYYMWGIRDLPYRPTEVSIVFHDITNWTAERTWLNVYLFNLGSTGFWSAGKDLESTTLPDSYPWTVENLVDATWVYDWQGGDIFDVVFTTSNPVLLSSLSGGNTFRIGIDPDCQFRVAAITVESTAPVPEPATLLLLGSGLLALAGFRGKRS